MPQATTDRGFGRFGRSETVTAARILVVEDDTDVRRLLTLALTQAGYRVDDAATAWDGLRLLEMHEYAVVLSDYALPGRDGVWMLNQAESEGLLERTRGVLLVTAHPSPAGADRMTVVRKPLDLDILLRQIETLICPARYASANSEPIDANAPSSSRRSRAKQNRM